MSGTRSGPRSRLACAATAACLLFAGLTLPSTTPASAADIAASEFELVWQRTESPVADGSSQRSWLWGPDPRTEGMLERYLDAQNNERLVQYFDKGRMEINDITADPSDPWFVTSGLLTRELISGRIQIGHRAFLNTGSGAEIHFAGDPNPDFPLYRDLASVVDLGQPDRRGEPTGRVLTPDGITTMAVHAADPNVENVEYITYLGPAGVNVSYNVPRAFWEYMHQSGVVVDSNGQLEVADPLYQWIYVLGFPISDPFWVEAPVGGVTQWILVQPFERRILTYTPDNPPGWQVEMGNIGQHYRLWRAEFTDIGRVDGNRDYFGMVTGDTWRFGTTNGVDEIWNILGTTESFIPGSAVIARRELTIDGRRITYWSVAEDGMFLHGWELRDGQDNIRDLMLYTPPIHVLPAEPAPATLVTETRAISMTEPATSTIVTSHIDTFQLVSTPAGVFGAWRVNLVVPSGMEISHGLGARLWFAADIGTIQWIDEGFSAHLRTSSRLNP